jgi:hypothetical protein
MLYGVLGPHVSKTVSDLRTFTPVSRKQPPRLVMF